MPTTINLGFVAVAGGTADVITATYSPAPLALTDKMLLVFRASASNATTTPTINVNGLGARTIVKKGGGALLVGDIPAALADMIIVYDLANTRFELLNPAKLTATDLTGTKAQFNTACSDGDFIFEGDARLTDSRYDKSIVKDLTDVSLTGTTTETKVWTSALIPAGTILTNDILEMFVKWGATSSGTNKTLRMYINTIDSLVGATLISTQIVSLTTRANIHERQIEIENAASSQKIAAVAGNIQTDQTAVNSVPSTLTLDFTANAYYLIASIQLANAGSTGNIWSVILKNNRL